jgi:hypothetical protein
MEVWMEVWMEAWMEAWIKVWMEAWMEAWMEVWGGVRGGVNGVLHVACTQVRIAVCHLRPLAPRRVRVCRLPRRPRVRHEGSELEQLRACAEHARRRRTDATQSLGL